MLMRYIKIENYSSKCSHHRMPCLLTSLSN